MSTSVISSDQGQPLIQSLRQFSTDEERNRFIDAHPELLTPEAVADLNKVVLEHLRVNTNEALSLAEAGLLVAARLGDANSLALATRCKANALYIIGRHEEAVALHETARQHFEAAGNDSEVARSLSASLQPLLLLGEYDRAFAAVARAQEIFAREGDQLRLARLDINTGNIYYRQDRFADALACYKRAYQVVLDHGNREGIGAALANIAVCCISLGDFPQALDAYERAREFYEQHDMPLLRAQADYNIAYLYYLRGEYSRAIEMLRATRIECQKIGERYHHSLCNLDLSELYLELNLSAEAAELARQAIAGFEELRMPYENAKALAFEAIAMSQQGQAFQALKIFVRSREMFVKENNQVWPSLLDLYQALVLFNEGRHFEAKRLAKSALEFFDSSMLPSKAVLCRLLLARIAQRTGHQAEAHRECSAALQKLEPLQTPVLKHQAYLLMGKIHATGGRKPQAYEAFRASRDALETLRSNLHGEELKLSFLKNRLEVYELLVESCLAESQSPGSLEEAFTYMEEAKSRTLMDLMLQPVWSREEDEGGQSELVRRMRGLREELNWYYSLIELEQLRPEQRSPDHIQRLEAQARARENDLIQALQESSLAEAGRAGLQVQEKISLEAIRGALPADTLLIEYFQAGDKIYAAVLDRERLGILPVTLMPRVAGALRLLQFQLSKFRLGSEYTKAFGASLIQSTQAHLRTLYDELLLPIRDLLDGQHLLFVPHGALHYVPFHALYDGERYLIDSHTVSYAPSASVYVVCSQKPVNTSGPALLMGIPDAAAPFIENEVRALAGIVRDPELHIGTDASVAMLRQVGPACRLLHIATHGYFRQDSPMFSSIRMGDSQLSLYDLYQLHLPVEIVTLSGCATGLNVVAAGDEIIGLARGLFQAGARSLLLSLWDVHDESTATFMTHFYQSLEAGNGKAAAHRQALNAVRERSPHPYQWAPFVLMGTYQ